MTGNRRVAWLVLVAAALSALVISTRVEGPPRTNEDRVRALSEDFACPTCDALYDVGARPAETPLSCERCHRVLIAPSRRAGVTVILLALTSVVLVIGATTQPFLTVKRFFLTQNATLIETALAFEGPLLVLSEKR